MKKKDKKGADDRYGIWVISAVSVVLLILGASWGLTDWLIAERSERGTFGDQFGAVNALFSGLAFALLIVTLILQRRELILQREELSYTREELAGQREELKKQGEAFIEQNKAINQQRFENTFFNLLKMHCDIVRHLPEMLDHNEKGIVINRTEYFEIIFKEMRSEYKQGNINVVEYIEFLTTLWQYFSNLYRTIKFVDDSSTIDEKEKHDYVCILQAQLSYYELQILFYYGLNKDARVKFKPLAEKYALFNNLDQNELLDPKHASEYTAGAYEYKPSTEKV